MKKLLLTLCLLLSFMSSFAMDEWRRMIDRQFIDCYNTTPVLMRRDIIAYPHTEVLSEATEYRFRAYKDWYAGDRYQIIASFNPNYVYEVSAETFQFALNNSIYLEPYN